MLPIIIRIKSKLRMWPVNGLCDSFPVPHFFACFPTTQSLVFSLLPSALLLFIREGQLNHEAFLYFLTSSPQELFLITVWFSSWHISLYEIILLLFHFNILIFKFKIFTKCFEAMLQRTLKPTPGIFFLIVPCGKARQYTNALFLCLLL